MDNAAVLGALIHAKSDGPDGEDEFYGRFAEPVGFGAISSAFAGLSWLWTRLSDVMMKHRENRALRRFEV